MVAEPFIRNCLYRRAQLLLYNTAQRERDWEKYRGFFIHPKSASFPWATYSQKGRFSLLGPGERQIRAENNL